MKKIRIFFGIFLLSFGLISAQIKVVNIQTAAEQPAFQESYPVDVRPLLERFNKANGIDLQKLETIPQQLKKVAWNFIVGSQKSWWASDLRTGASPAFYLVPSTCRKVGTKSYVFVADSLWNNGKVDQNAVDSVQTAFDLKTPGGSINPSKGIYQNDVDTFGTPPDVDGDSKIIILILDIRDGYKGTGGFTAGYFYGYNEGNGTNSNKAEIYYLDGDPLNLKTSGGLTEGMSTTAHEFQHMIHFNYDKDESTFINESMSLIAEVINGYALREQNSFNNETNHYLFDWRGDDNTKVLTDYSRAARYSIYLYEQFGKDILKKIVQSPLNEEVGITSALENLSPSTPRRFSDILEDWFVANFLNDSNVDSRYGYLNTRAGKGTAREHFNPNVSNYDDGVYKYGVQYITYVSGSNLQINFDTKGNSSIKIKAIKTGNSSKIVENVSANTNYTVPDFGTTYKRVTFAVYIADQSAFGTGPFSFSYTSSGTFENKPFEIAYDNTEPVGYLQLSAGDSVSVQFDGVQGGKLDSIKVALRGIAPINGSVLEYVGLVNRMGGKKLASFTATSSLSAAPPVINQGAQYPYQIPYPNWVKVDLRSYNIDASNSFVVEFPVGEAYPASNRVVVTDYQSESAYHSYAYSSTSTPPKWTYYGVQNKPGYIFLYLIRAYLSFTITGVKEVVELMPSSFSLAQNYPNPFNPSTNISYRLQGTSYTTLKVYDMLGREVATLVNEEQPAGTYQIVWNGTDNFGNKVTSGVYIYRIQAGDFVSSKKMILMK